MAEGYFNRDYSLSESAHGPTVENQCYCYQAVIDGTKTEDAFIVTKDDAIMAASDPLAVGIVKYLS